MKAAELFVESISNPFKAQEAAREMALRSDMAQDEIEILRFVLQPWWDNETDARNLCRYLGALEAVEGQGSVAHRRAVKITVLCARSALPWVREQDRDEITWILDTFDAWACGKAPEADLQTLRDRVQMLWSAAADAGARAAARTATRTADAATWAAVAVACGTTEWRTSYDHHLAHLSDMIRGEIPVCPIDAP